MPLVDGKVVSPDAALEAGHCPECGADLKVHNPVAELNRHWTTVPKDDRRGAEAVRRRNMLLAFIERNRVRTTNQPKLSA
jgi:hypothetical protein